MFGKLVVSTLLGMSAVYGATSDCTESIEVLTMDFNIAGYDCDYWMLPCTDLIGTYYFSGRDAAGYPTYTQPETGAYFGVFDYYGLATSFYYEDAWSNVFYYSPTWDHFSDVDVITSNCPVPQWQVEYGALDGSTEIQYYTRPGTNTPPLFIKAQLDDCDYIGFDNAPAPTPQPTDRPTNSQGSCPNYDNTVYGDCYGDAHCNSCQAWGCASCEQGYYKMGNLKRCQSCTSNYPNCAQCGDWNGCTTCDSGYSLQYDASCVDEICV